jgi:hypothetical protein
VLTGEVARSAPPQRPRADEISQRGKAEEDAEDADEVAQPRIDDPDPAKESGERGEHGPGECQDDAVAAFPLGQVWAFGAP